MSNKVFGYARVSTRDQNLDLQIDALKKAGCDEIITEKASGKSADNRPELQRLLGMVREGDTVVCWKLDRISRSLVDLTCMVKDLGERGTMFKCLTNDIDTTTASGRLIFSIFASLCEFERELISERTKAGMAAARARGRMPGKKPGLDDAAKSKARAAAQLRAAGNNISEISRSMGIPRPTLYRYLAWYDKLEKKA
jgi:DNA invertase Pin-like site-specific DNA recombinase